MCIYFFAMYLGNRSQKWQEFKFLSDTLQNLTGHYGGSTEDQRANKNADSEVTVHKVSVRNTRLETGREGIQTTFWQRIWLCSACV